MARLAMVGFLLLAISPLGAMGDETSDAKKALKALTESFEQKMQEWQAGFGTLDSDEDRQKHFENRPTADSTAAEIMALAAKHREEIGLDAVMWVMQNRASGEGQKQALGMLKDHYLDDEAILPLVWDMSYGMEPANGEILEKLVSDSKVENLRGVAHYSLAKSLLGKIQMAQYVEAASPEEYEQMKEYFGEETCAMLKSIDAAALNARAEKLLDTVSKSYASIPTRRGGMLGDVAAKDLFEIRNLSIGKVAPEIEGEDLFGTTFKLSDYRGKVIFLDFWGDW